MGYWLRGHEDERNNCLSKIQLVGSKISQDIYRTGQENKFLFSLFLWGDKTPQLSRTSSLLLLCRMPRLDCIQKLLTSEERINYNLYRNIYKTLLTSVFVNPHKLIQGSYPFFNKKFKDFQGHISHFSRTPFNAKKSLSYLLLFSSSTTWAILSWRSFCVCFFYSLENPGWTKLAPKFKDFPAPTAIFKDLQGV